MAGKLQKNDAFYSFVEQAKIFESQPLDEDWLLNIWTGADGNADRAINHLLDTPDSKKVYTSAPVAVPKLQRRQTPPAFNDFLSPPTAFQPPTAPAGMLAYNPPPAPAPPPPAPIPPPMMQPPPQAPMMQLPPPQPPMMQPPPQAPMMQFPPPQPPMMQQQPQFQPPMMQQPLSQPQMMQRPSSQPQMMMAPGNTMAMGGPYGNMMGMPNTMDQSMAQSMGMNTMGMMGGPPNSMGMMGSPPNTMCMMSCPPNNMGMGNMGPMDPMMMNANTMGMSSPSSPNMRMRPTMEPPPMQSPLDMSGNMAMMDTRNNQLMPMATAPNMYRRQNDGRMDPYGDHPHAPPRGRYPASQPTTPRAHFHDDGYPRSSSRRRMRHHHDGPTRPGSAPDMYRVENVGSHVFDSWIDPLDNGSSSEEDWWVTPMRQPVPSIDRHPFYSPGRRAYRDVDPRMSHRDFQRAMSPQQYDRYDSKYDRYEDFESSRYDDRYDRDDKYPRYYDDYPPPVPLRRR